MTILCSDGIHHTVLFLFKNSAFSLSWLFRTPLCWRAGDLSLSRNGLHDRENALPSWAVRLLPHAVAADPSSIQLCLTIIPLAMDALLSHGQIFEKTILNCPRVGSQVKIRWCNTGEHQIHTVPQDQKHTLDCMLHIVLSILSHLQLTLSSEKYYLELTL